MNVIDMSNTRVGYGALSVSDPSFDGRLKALKKVVEREGSKNLSSMDATSTVGLAYTLMRLLVEPRDEQKAIQKEIPKGSRKHPSKRELTDEEKHLYEKIKIALENAGVVVLNAESKIISSRLALAHYRLGMFFRKLNPEISSFHHKECLKLSPDETIRKKSKFWLATLGDETSETVIDRCPEEYVVSLYASFASKFDDLLVNKLKYETPSKLRKIVDKVRQNDQKALVRKSCMLGADLGCGTGLSGLSFQDCVDELYGIDLSPQMIEKASSRECYKDLFIGDLEDIFKILEVEFDLVVACDVFVYIGDLRQIFQSVYAHLCKNTGMFAFSTECLDELSATNRYVLHKNARFSHKKSYIEMLAREVGFSIDLLEKSVIRKNQGKDVEGLLVVLSRGH